jgi:hypothetical protein
MLQFVTLPSGRPTTALGFGCASLLRIPDKEQRQRLLDIAFDGGIRHFDVARLYGLGQAEAELANLLRRHPGQISVATKFGLGDARPPNKAARHQGGLRRLLRSAPGLRSVVRRVYSGGLVPRNFGTTHCRLSLETSLSQLGVDAVDLLLLHEPNPRDLLDLDLEYILKEFQQKGLIGGYGLSGAWPDFEHLMTERPALAGGLVQWEDDMFEPEPTLEAFSSEPSRLLGRFGRVRRSLVKIKQALEAVPQLQHYWSDRMNINLADSISLGVTLIGAALAKYPSELLLYSSTDADRLSKTLILLNNPPWHITDAIAFEEFWRPSGEIKSLK